MRPGVEFGACGVPELGYRRWSGILRSPLVLVNEAAEDRLTLDPLPGKVDDRVVRPGRAELAAAMVWGSKMRFSWMTCIFPLQRGVVRQRCSTRG